MFLASQLTPLSWLRALGLYWERTQLQKLSVFTTSVHFSSRCGDQVQ